MKSLYLSARYGRMSYVFWQENILRGHFWELGETLERKTIANQQLGRSL